MSISRTNMSPQRTQTGREGALPSSAAGGLLGQQIPSQHHIVGDARFSRLHSDPRFRRLPKSKVKVPLDARFAHALSEKRFRDPGVNKRGFTRRPTNSGEHLHEHYQLSEVDGKERHALGFEGVSNLVNDDSDGLRGLKITKGEDEGFDVEHVEKACNESAITRRIGRRGRKTVEKMVEIKHSPQQNWQRTNRSSKVGTQSFALDSAVDGSEDESPESLSSSSSEDENDVGEKAADYVEEKIPTTSEETRRLAVVNMDWEHVRAVNLLVLMHSFLPKEGVVRSVTIYPSEFGIQRMEDENVRGPKNIFASRDSEEEDDGEPDEEKLRAYEIDKLRYYYAVVECDSSSTAAHLYQNCDGLEFERSSNTLDLRYIPDDMKILRPPKDVATEIPLEYKAVEFETRALQHSTVKLTWDDDETVRKKTLRRNFNRIDMKEMDFRDYVASGNSESESENVDERKQTGMDDGVDGNVEVRSKYLSILADDGKSKSIGGTKAEKGNIEIKFHTGLDELSKRLLSKARNDKVDETVWKKYLDRRKGKKGRRKQRGGDYVSNDEYGTDDGEGDFFPGTKEADPFSDPFFQESEGGDVSNDNGRHSLRKIEPGASDQTVALQDVRRKRLKDDAGKKEKDAAREQAELDLLLMDDNAMKSGEEVRSVQSEKQSRKKQRLSKRRLKDHSDNVLETKISSANIDDPRFALLFNSHHFSLDPTNPNYSKVNSRIAEHQRLKLRRSEDAEERFEVDDLVGKQLRTQRRGEHAKADLSSLVRSLKSKVRSKESNRRRAQ